MLFVFFLPNSVQVLDTLLSEIVTVAANTSILWFMSSPFLCKYNQKYLSSFTGFDPDFRIC